MAGTESQSCACAQSPTQGLQHNGDQFQELNWAGVPVSWDTVLETDTFSVSSNPGSTRRHLPSKRHCSGDVSLTQPKTQSTALAPPWHRGSLSHQLSKIQIK